MVLVHGHYGNLANFDELGPLLAKSHRVVAYDQRGHGWSENGPISIEAFNADLDAVIGAFGLESPWLFGGSFGSLICLAYVESGRRLAGLICEDGTAGDFVTSEHDNDPPSDEPTIVPSKIYKQIVGGYSALGPVGEASATRGAVRRVDGFYEIRPSPRDLHAKESAFIRVPVTHAFGLCAGRALFLAARTDETPEGQERAKQVAALETDSAIVVRRFDTGHWISAADAVGVAREVVAFITERS